MRTHSISFLLHSLVCASRTFKLLRETEYDPITDLTHSRVTDTWVENASIRKALIPQ